MPFTTPRRYFAKRTQANVWVQAIITRVTLFHTHFLLLDAGTLVPFCPRMSMHPNLAKSICLDLFQALLTCWPRATVILALHAPHRLQPPLAIAVAEPVHHRAMHLVHLDEVILQALRPVLVDALGRKGAANAHVRGAIALHVDETEECVSLPNVGAEVGLVGVAAS